ncbi:MAG: heavy metal translocating P-type ATPase [Candidatus Endonucleobacter bathymodioli]|uniref:Copper-exporting P-type ATPase n=1 Tax=Candidatus Endonucleibacter bathymodioli TaxID=539814 RepID=A0AA90SND5_9GAMM|nr:heavy metal translocating P-type ATPase [Candidatus Endonucleobacter bathymodioli]
MEEKEIQLLISGASCSACVTKIEQSLSTVAGVLEVSVNLLDWRATVIGQALSKDLITAVERLGYRASIIQPMSLQFSIPSMHCASCVNTIEQAVRLLPGVKIANASIVDKLVTVEGSVNPARVLDALNKAGYPGILIDSDEFHFHHNEQEDKLRYRYLLKHTATALALGIPLMVWGLLTGDMEVSSPTRQLVWGIVGLLVLLMLVVSGRHFFQGMWRALQYRSANMDTLVAMGTGIAWFYSMVVVCFPESLPASARHVYFEASAMIIGLINLGHALELKAKGKTSEAVKKLLGLQVKTARVVKGNQDIDIAVGLIKKGDVIRVRPGEKIAVDGSVIEGASFLDESMLTGEPFPVRKGIGDQISAGTLNKNSSLLFRAEKVGKDTALARIITLVRKAQNTKMPIARLVDKVSSLFVPVVIGIAILSALVWYIVGPEPKVAYMLVVATTVLIIACPCALGLATPMSVMVGVGKAAQIGMLIRKGEALQQASKITIIVVDKTGTVTTGCPQIVNIVCCDGFSENTLLMLAASIEKSSEHPLAEAILTAARERSLSLSPAIDFNAISGHGVTGQTNQKQIMLGNKKLMSLKDISISPLKLQAETFSEQGQTPVYIAIDNQLAGLMTISDPLRHDSLDAIKRLHRIGLKVIMLTGDNMLTARAVARQVGITHFIADTLPEGKTDYILQLQQQGETVGMSGDGINDAPALAQADVSFAIGSGADIAIESADITLLRSSLHGLADAIELSRATLFNIKQNLLGAFIYNALSIPIAAGVLFPITGGLLSPVVAGTAMALSSLTVVINANRLKLFKPSRK